MKWKPHQKKVGGLNLSQTKKIPGKKKNVVKMKYFNHAGLRKMKKNRLLKISQLLYLWYDGN